MNKNLGSALSILLLYGLLVPASHAGLVLYGAMTSGGDTLASAYTEDGDDIDLKAGGLFHLALGYEKKLESGGIRVTYGYKFDSLDAENGDAEITRFPLEAVLYKTFSKRHNLGGGLVYEASPQYEESIDGLGSLDIDFDDATGFMLFYGYSTGSFEWGLRYTDIEYEYEDEFFSLAFDGTSYGFYVSSFFD